MVCRYGFCGRQRADHRLWLDSADECALGTIAAAVLTTSTTTEVIQVSGSGLTTETAGTLVLNKGIYINSATTAFTGGTGTVQVTIQAENITT